MDETYISLLPFVVACAAAASTGMLFKPGDWYRDLEKPGWTPPDWSFGVVWTVLYCLIAWAGWRVGLRADSGAAALPLGLWACQITLNALWSPVFFGLRRPGTALPIIVLLLISVIAMTAVFMRVDLASGIAMIPYVIWVAIATALNVSIWRRNTQTVA